VEGRFKDDRAGTLGRQKTGVCRRCRREQGPPTRGRPHQVSARGRSPRLSSPQPAPSRAEPPPGGKRRACAGGSRARNPGATSGVCPRSPPPQALSSPQPARLRSSSREPSRCWEIIFFSDFFLGPLCPVHTVLWHGLAAAAAAANLLSPAAGNGTARSASRDDGSDFWRRRQAGFWGGRSCPGVGLPRPRAARKWWSLAPAACRRPGLTLDVRMCICAHGCACACVCTRSEDATVFSSLAQHDSSSPRGRRGRRACLEPASASHAAGYKSADNRSELCPCSMRAH